MSSLLIDIGNSRLKWAVKFRDGLEIGVPAQSANGNIDFDAIWKYLEPPARVLVSNVLGEPVGRMLEQWVEARWSVSVEFVQSRGRGYGVENGYSFPGQLGVDRWVALVAARAMVKEPVCVVDCGTAITLDVVDNLGRHHGGLICPGVRLMQDALILGTRSLRLERAKHGALLGRDTGTGISSGCLMAASGMIEKLIAEAERFFKMRFKLLITGGDADVIMERLRISYTHLPDLVLQGLAVIEENCESAS